MPTAHATDVEYGVFAAQHGRVHGSAADYEMRAALFAKNKAFIDAWNDGVRTDAAAAAANGAAPPVNYTMAVNRYADWTEVCAARALCGTLRIQGIIKNGIYELQ